MSSNGWTNDSTWGVAAACDNTYSAQAALQDIVSGARGGDIDGAAERLREAVSSGGLVATTLPSWVDLSEVNWRELVSMWAQDSE